MDIVFYDGSAFETWNPETVARDGAGGSELMLSDITTRLAKRGHKVRVYVKCEGIDGIYDGVDWRPIRRMDEERDTDVLVAWRTPEVVGSNYLVRPRATVFVATDSHYDGRLTLEKGALVDKFVVMSEWHRRIFEQMHPFTSGRTVVIRTAVDHELFAELMGKGVCFDGTARLIHTSAPTRSLKRALLAMPRIREAYPAATLHVYHGFLTLKMFAESRADLGMKNQIAELEGLLGAYEKHGVLYWNRQNRRTIYRALLQSALWVYPTHTAETSCMAAQEAQAAGADVVAFSLGALPETVKLVPLLDHRATDQEYVDMVVACLRVRSAEQNLERIQEARKLIPDLPTMVDEYEALLSAELVKRQATDGASPAEAPGAHKICLAMILKNERKIIGETLRRVKPLIDEWFICDTGSTDGTEDEVRRELADLPGEVVSRPWVNFGHNRTELIELASKRGTRWLLLLDSDCIIETKLDREELRQKLIGADQYLVDGVIGTIFYDKLFMIRTGPNWRYEMPTHEWLFCDGPMSFRKLDGITIHETGMSARRLGGKKATEDIALLEAYLKDPAVKHRARATFYLAQSYQDAGQTALAFSTYLRRACMPEGPEEGYVAMLQAGRAAATLGQPWDAVRAIYRSAANGRPWRAEARYELGRSFRLTQDYAKAEAELRVALQTPLPAGDSLFVDRSVHQWRVKDELAVVLSWCDDRDKRLEAARLFRELLDSGDLPKDREQHVREGEKLCLELAARASNRVPAGDGGGSMMIVYNEVVHPQAFTVVSPPSDKFSAAQALDDVSEMLCAGLLDLGLTVRRAAECEAGTRNIIVGAHAVLPGWLTTSPPPGTVIYQTEVPSSPWWENPKFQQMMKEYEVWDYSEDNVSAYVAKGLPLPKVVPLGYSPRIVQSFDGEKEYDVIFVGSMCDRRLRVLDALREKGLTVLAPEAFGEARRKLIASAKLLVNIHYYEGAPLEQARLVPLLSSGVPIVSEVSGAGDQWIASAILHKTTIEHLAAECECLIKNPDLRQNAGAHGRRVVQEHTMAESISRALAMPPSTPVPPSSGKVEPRTEAAPGTGARLALNLGCSDAHRSDYVNVDRVPPADVVADLSKEWPWDDSSVDLIRAHDFIEHIENKTHVMNEAWRVLKPGGLFDIVVPTTDGRGAYQDPDHKSYWNRNSFWYYEYGNPHRDRFAKAYGIRACFSVESAREWTTPAQVAYVAITLRAERYIVEGTGPLVDLKPPPVAAPAIPPKEVIAERAGSGITIVEARPSMAGMMRVKNESRWIERSIESLLPLCDRVFVLDDHSSDDTRELVRSLPRTFLFESPFEGLDEVRDKNFLLEQIKRTTEGRSDVWIVNIDGDEELERGSARDIRRAVRDVNAAAFKLRVKFLWNSGSVVRVDGVYGAFERASVFRVTQGAMFESPGWAAAGLHCGNCPLALRAPALPSDGVVLHYGYMDRAERVRKYRWYNEKDPNNENEDRYRHIIQGDGPCREGEEDIVFPGAEEALKWAGPLKFEALR